MLQILSRLTGVYIAAMGAIFLGEEKKALLDWRLADLDKQKTMMSRWRKTPLIMVRILGLFILGIGTLLIYSV